MVAPGLEDAELLQWTCEGAVDDLAGRCAPIVAEFAPAVSANDRFAVDLRTPREGAKKLTRVELAVRIAVPVAREEIAFDASEVGATKKLGGASVTFKKLDGTTVHCAVSGSLDGESGRPAIHPASWPADLGDAVVRGYSESGAEIGGAPILAFPMECVEFARAPKRIVVSAVTKLAIRQTTVVFTDVPLPK
jgi:hypothetical protein